MFRFALFPVTVLLCLFPQMTYGQKEATKWYFGNKAGLDFNDISPVALTDGMINTNEGCSSIADSSGQLLFYTDGITVWNKNHSVMAGGNGLKGHPSSTHSSLVVRQPKSNLYYLFTTSLFGGAGFFGYSIVDMDGDNGKGKVVTKNVKLLDGSTEKIAAVKHSNGIDFWVATIQHATSKLYTYKITENGLSTFPSIHALNVSLNNVPIGQIKFSSSGDLLAFADYKSNIFLLDFENQSGTYSKMRKITGFDLTYGIELSPGGRYIYVSNWGNKLLQCPITDEEMRITHCTNVGSGNGIEFGQLQLAPDNKIYVAIINKPYVGRINEPENEGMNCNFVDSVIWLGTGKCLVGLPTYIQSYFNNSTKIKTQNFCKGDATLIDLEFDKNPDSLTIEFGDGSFLYGYTDTVYHFSHVYPDTGTFALVIYYKTGSLKQQEEKKIRISKRHIDFLIQDTAICIGDTLTLTTPPADSYLWNNVIKDSVLRVFASGTNVVLINQSGCESTDTAYIQVHPYPTISLPDTVWICKGDSIWIDVNDSSCVYWWSNGFYGPGQYLKDSGQYQIQKAFAGCSTFDSIRIDLKFPPVVKLGNDTFLCSGSQIQLQAQHNATRIEWNDYSTMNNIRVDKSGKFWCTGFLSGCTATDTIQVDMILNPDVNLGADTILCHGDQLLLDVTDTNCTYLWNTGSTASQITISQPGMYKAEVNRRGCSGSDEKKIDYISVPEFDLPDQSILCEDDVLNLSVPTGPYQQQWSTGETSATIRVTRPGLYSIHAGNLCGSLSDETEVILKPCMCFTYIPNAFTPGTDQVNDNFKPSLNCSPVQYLLQIYNRWGNLVYQTTDANSGWNGLYNNEPCPVDVYAWKLEVVVVNDAGRLIPTALSGHLTLLR